MKLYHRVPYKMRGQVLYPLRTLKDKFPDIYALESEKYSGRENVLNTRIPLLNCSWDEVLFLSCIHPEKIRAELLRAGHPITQSLDCLEFDSEDLDLEHITVILFEGSSGNSERNIPFDPTFLTSCSEVPELTKKYYAEMRYQGRTPLTLAYTPHVLYRGTLTISNSKLISA